jgi:hypothetical protein
LGAKQAKTKARAGGVLSVCCQLPAQLAAVLASFLIRFMLGADA